MCMLGKREVNMIIEVKNGDELLAIILPAGHTSDGVEFFTPNSYSQQLAFMHHKQGKCIEAHKHNRIRREVDYTQEVLFIRKGKLRVDFYDQENRYIYSRVLSEGDIILLISGGHGFEVIEEIEMVEVKQGPYFGDMDKTRFDAVDKNKIIIKE